MANPHSAGKVTAGLLRLMLVAQTLKKKKLNISVDGQWVRSMDVLGLLIFSTLPGQITGFTITP